MAFRSVIDIDVNDEKFSEFLTRFEKFSRDAKDIPEPFKKMDRRIEAARDHFGRLGGHLGRHMREGTAATKGFTVELHHAGQKMATFTARVSQGRSELSKMGETGRKTFSLIGRMGKDLFKVIPLVGGAAAGAGLAAVELYRHQSNTILDRYKTAKIMNMTPGQVAAVDTAYRPVLTNPAQTLSAMRQAELMPTAQSFFARAVGAGWQHMSKMELYADAIKKAKRLADHTNTDMLGVVDRVRGFSQIGITAQDLALLKRTSWATVDRTIANAQKQQAAMNFSATTGRTMSQLAVTISQKEVELSTHLSRLLAKGAPAMNTALNKLVNSVDWAANRINAALKGMATGNAPTHGQGVVMDAAGKVYNAARHGKLWSYGNSQAAKSQAWMDKQMMDLFPKGSWLYRQAQKSYEMELEAEKRYRAAVSVGSKLPPSVLQRAEAIAKRKGLYLNPQNWRKYNDPGDIDPMITVDGYRINAYEKFKSMGAAWRNMARTIQSYPVRPTVLAETRHFEGYHFHPKNAKQVAQDKLVDQHAADIARWMKVGENQKLNLNNPSTLAALLTGLARLEQPHQSSPQELYQVIKRALIDAHRETSSGTPASSVGAQIHMAAH